MELMHPSAKNKFRADLSLVQNQVRSGVVDKRTRAADKHWALWVDFCKTHAVDPWFRQREDPILYLQVFAARYRDGRLAPSGKPVRSGTVTDALRSVGQTYKSLGAADVRLDPHGSVDFCLKRQLHSYTKEDPPSQRVKPIPIQVVRTIVNAALNDPSTSADFRAIADMICIAFFFMCRPGEHTVNKNNTPFRLGDARLIVGSVRLDLPHATDSQIRASTSVSLVFTTQKNGVKGEVISHGLSGDPHCCPVQAVIRRVLYLRTTPELNSLQTPLCAFLRTTPTGIIKTTYVSSIQIKQALQAGIAAQGNTLQIAPEKIDARSLQAGGATALLCAQVDPNSIQLMGRKQSDAMIRYLHVAAKSTLEQYAAKMFHGGHYSFNLGLTVPVY